MAVPDVTVVVVSWNVRDELRRCLMAVRNSEGVRMQTVVVDNASTDGSLDMVRSEFPDVRAIANATNRGFAAAVNQGMTGTSGDVLLLNPDVAVAPHAIRELVRALERHERTGVVGGRLRYPDGEPQPSMKRFPDALDLFLVLSKVPNLFPGIASKYNGLGLDYDREQTVDQVMGSFFLIRRQTLDEVGPFDEGFFLWFEEVDFCKRAKAKGWGTLYTPEAVAVHTRNASFSQQQTTWKQRVLRQSMLHYAEKHLGRFATATLKPALLLSSISAPLIDAFHLVKPTTAKDL